MNQNNQLNLPSERIIELKDLQDLANEYADTLNQGDVIALCGEIGAGKTTFLRCLLQTLGMTVADGFCSPTFTILNQYDLPHHHINHLDLYRLNSFDDLVHLDLIGCFENHDNLTFVEWGNRFAALHPYYTKEIYFDFILGQSELRCLKFISP